MDRTLSGIPRVSGQPPETPAQHIRNAMQALSLWQEQQPDKVAVCIPWADFEALYARLAHAVMLLETHPVTLRTHGNSADCPDVQAGNATRCPGHTLNPKIAF